MASLPCAGVVLVRCRRGSSVALARGPLNFPAHPNGRAATRVPRVPRISRRRPRSRADRRECTLPCVPRRGRQVAGGPGGGVRRQRRAVPSHSATPAASDTSARQDRRPARRPPTAAGRLAAADAAPARTSGIRRPPGAFVRPVRRAGEAYRTARDRRSVTTPSQLAMDRGVLDCASTRPTTSVSPRAGCRACGIARQRPAIDLHAAPLDCRPRRRRAAHDHAVSPTARRRSGRPAHVTARPARTLVDCAREWPLEPTPSSPWTHRTARRAHEPGLDSDAARRPRTPMARGGRQARRRRPPLRGRPGRVATRDTRPAAHRRRRLPGTPELQVEIRAPPPAESSAWSTAGSTTLRSPSEFDGRIKYLDPWRGRSPERVLWVTRSRREDDSSATSASPDRRATSTRGA